MQRPAIDRLATALAATLLTTRRSAANILALPENADRLALCRNRMDDCVPVPKDDGTIVVFSRSNGRLSMVATLSARDVDLIRWRQLPDAQRRGPDDLPLH